MSIPASPSLLSYFVTQDIIYYHVEYFIFTCLLLFKCIVCSPSFLKAPEGHGFVSFTVEGRQNLSAQRSRICFFDIRIIFSWLFFRNSGYRRSFKTEKLHFCRRHLQGSSPFTRMSPSLYQEENVDSKSLETLINREDTDLNLCNNPTLVYCFAW